MLALKKRLRMNRLPLIVALVCSFIDVQVYSQEELPAPRGASEPLVQVTSEKYEAGDY